MGKFSEDFFVRIRIDETALRHDFQKVGQGISQSFNTSTAGVNQSMTSQLNLIKSAVKNGVLPYNEALVRSAMVEGGLGHQLDETNIKMTIHHAQLNKINGGLKAMASNVVHAIGKMMLWGIAGTMIFGTLRSLQGLIGAGKEWITVLEDMNAVMGGTVKQQMEFVFIAKSLGIEAKSFVRVMSRFSSQVSTAKGQGMIRQFLGASPEEIKEYTNDTWTLFAKINEQVQKTGKSAKFLNNIFGDMKAYEIGKMLQLSVKDITMFREAMESLGMSLDKDGFQQLLQLQHEIQMTNAQTSLLGLKIYRELQPAMKDMGDATVWAANRFAELVVTMRELLDLNFDSFGNKFQIAMLKIQLASLNYQKFLAPLSGKSKLEKAANIARINSEIADIQSKLLRDFKTPPPKETGKGFPGEKTYGISKVPAVITPLKVEPVTRALDLLNYDMAKSALEFAQVNANFEGTLEQFQEYKKMLPELEKDLSNYEKEYEGLRAGEDDRLKKMREYKTQIEAQEKIVGNLNEDDKEYNTQQQTKLNNLRALFNKEKDANDLQKKAYDNRQATIGNLKTATEKINEFNNAILVLIARVYAGKGSLNDISELLSKVGAELGISPGMTGGINRILGTAMTAGGGPGDIAGSIGAEALGGGGGGGILGRTFGGMFGGPIGAIIGGTIGASIGEALIGSHNDIEAFNNMVQDVTDSLETYNDAIKNHSNTMDTLEEQMAYAQQQYNKFKKEAESIDVYDKTWYGRELNTGKEAAKKEAQQAADEWKDKLDELSSWYPQFQEELAIAEHENKMKVDEDSEIFKLNMYKQLYEKYADDLDRETRWMLEENIWRIEQNININADVRDVRDIEMLSKQIVERIVLAQDSRYSTMPYGRF